MGYNKFYLKTNDICDLLKCFIVNVYFRTLINRTP